MIRAAVDVVRKCWLWISTSVEPKSWQRSLIMEAAGHFNHHLKT